MLPRVAVGVAAVHLNIFQEAPSRPQSLHLPQDAEHHSRPGTS